MTISRWGSWPSCWVFLPILQISGRNTERLSNASEQPAGKRNSGANMSLHHAPPSFQPRLSGHPPGASRAASSALPSSGSSSGLQALTVPLALSTCHVPACRDTAGIGAWDLGRFLFCYKAQVPQSGTVSRGLTHEASRLSPLVVLLRATVTLSLRPVKAGSKGRVATEMGQQANGVFGVET